MDNRVFLADCGGYEQHKVDTAVRRILDGFGGIEGFNMRGKKVLVKANLLIAFPPDRAVTTHPAVVEAVCRAFIQAGADVTIADSPGGPFTQQGLNRLYTVTGMRTAAERSGASLNLDTSHRRVTCSERAATEFSVINAVADADLVVSVAKLKTHGLTYYTGAVKNLFGVVPGLEKPAMHSRFTSKFSFSQMLVNLCEVVKPGFSLVDGVVGMEGAGPSGGTPKACGVIGGAINPYALDLAMCRVAVLPHAKVGVLTEAIARGLCADSPERLQYIGDPPERFTTTFTPAITTSESTSVASLLLRMLAPQRLMVYLENRRNPYPSIRDNCTGCGKCAESCPRHIIDVDGGRAVIDRAACIRCYCCHEMCPIQAIDMVR